MRKLKHPIAMLRVILGVTQAAFARSLGISESYVKAMELGQRPPSEEVLQRMRVKYGIKREMIEEPLPPATSMEYVGRAGLMAFNAQIWAEVAPHLNEDAPKIFQQQTLSKITTLLEAAKRRKSAVAVLESLDQWIDATLKQFGLSRIFKELGGIEARYLTWKGDPQFMGTEDVTLPSKIAILEIVDRIPKRVWETLVTISVPHVHRLLAERPDVPVDITEVIIKSMMGRYPFQLRTTKTEVLPPLVEEFFASSQKVLVTHKSEQRGNKRKKAPVQQRPKKKPSKKPGAS